MTCMSEHVHGDECVTEPEALRFTYEDGDISAVISLPWSEELPNDLSCTVVKLSEAEEEYDALYESASQTVSAEGRSISSLQMYKLDWQSAGAPYELPAGSEPIVHLTVADKDPSRGLAAGLLFEENTGDPDVHGEAPGTFGDPELADDPVPEEAADEAPVEEAAAIMVPTRFRSMDSGSMWEGRYTATAVPMENGTAAIPLSAINTFGVTRERTTTIRDHYYKRVDSIEEIRRFYNAGYTEKYVLVYANGVAQAFGTDSWHAAPVEIRAARGYENRDYFTIVYINEDSGSIYGYRNGQQMCNPVDYRDRHWQIKPHPKNKNAFYLWQNEDINDELWTSWWDGNQMYLEHDDLTNTWRIHGTYYYFSLDENDSAVKVTDDRTKLTQTNLLLFRYVGGERNLTDYFDDTEAAAVTDGMPEPWSNHEYDNYKPVADSREGVLSSDESPINSMEMAYASDPATANIESVFGSKTKPEVGAALYNIQRENDGRVLTDKSVIYGSDDYNASGVAGFGRYEAGDFSVTLSALGQEWMETEHSSTTAPLDVVYVLDISGSMNEMYQGSRRWETAMKALNLSMKNVLARNPQNRVGLVAFSNSSKQILPLDRYTPNSRGAFLERCSSQYEYWVDYVTPNGATSTYYQAISARIQTAAGLRYEGNTAHGGIRPEGIVPVTDFGFDWAWSKTYTQHGIQGAYDTFLEMSKRRPDSLSFEAGGTRYPRQPVMILITDGDPTICSYNFMDPQKGPSYGQGETHGVEGYYTVLTANYFKSLTSVLYQKRLSFFTIGIGCDNHYTQAVLEPTPNRMAVCAAASDGSPEKQLYNLLENVPGKSGGMYTANIKSSWYKTYVENMPGLGYNSALIRGKNNLYHGKYHYCDKAWFGEVTEQTLNDILSDILNQVQLINNYSFLLQEGTGLEMTDSIGEGMTVKGTPVLCFYGNVYAADANPVTETDDAGNSTVTYRWTRTVSRRPSDSKATLGAVPLSGITAKITTTAAGNEIVAFSVPEEAMPTYYPDLYKRFYYEELPVRLIYRVGLSDAEKMKLQSSSNAAGEWVYHTSRYDKQTNNALTTVRFTPDPSNPYYSTALPREVSKARNVSSTSGYSFKEYVEDSGTVVQLLGNNGKLSVTQDDTLTLAVEKQWEGVPNPPESVTINLIAKLTIKLVRAEELGGTEAGYCVLDTVQLSEANGWRHQWVNLKKEELHDAERIFIYSDFKIEEVPNGYHATFQDEQGRLLAPEAVLVPDETFDLTSRNVVSVNGGTVMVVNSPSYALPHTGGSGTAWYTLVGISLCGLSCTIYMLKRHTSRYRDKGVNKISP